MKVHFLKKNQTLEEISAIYKLPVCMIARANRNFEEGFREDMPLLIPPPDFCRLYKAECRLEGRTLMELSAGTGAPLKDIMRLNGGFEGGLSEDDRVFLPQMGRLYTVGAGESIEDVIKNTGVSKEQLERLNDITCGIYKGRQLWLSKGDD